MDQILKDEERSQLLNCPLFRDCAPETVSRTLDDSGCSVHCFDTGQTLYRPHHFSRCLGILLSGRVRVTRDTLSISMLSPGELFGAAALFNDRPDYATTLTACAPCRVVLLTQELVSSLMDTDRQVRDNYIRYLSGRIRFLSGKIRSLAADRAEGKLKQHLLTTLSPQRPQLDCPATELAHRLGISRASLYRAFDALEGQGLIRRRGRIISVPDLAALEACEC